MGFGTFAYPRKNKKGKVVYFNTFGLKKYLYLGGIWILILIIFLINEVCFKTM
jgi:hypothetical protein